LSRLLVFSGPDGSGKSTLVSMLGSLLVSRGWVVGFSWVRGTHLLASLLARILSRFGAFRGVDNPYYGLRIPRGFRWMWLHIEFWSYIFYHLWRRVLALFHDVLLCDRGLLDFLVWIVSTLRYPGFLETIYGRFLLRLLQKEPIVYVYASTKTLEARADIPLEFLHREIPAYKTLAKHTRITCKIDTTNTSPTKTLAKLLECLKEGEGLI